MNTEEIHKAIITLTTVYDELNKRWENDTCQTDVYQVCRQEEYHNCYEKLKVANIESVILEILANALNEKILTRLRAGIENNICIYEARQTDFNNVNFLALCRIDEEHEFSGKLELLKKDRKDIQDYPYPTEQERNMLLKDNQQEINILQNERSDYIRFRTWISINFYIKIYELSQSYLSIINNYFPVEIEKEPTSEPEPVREETEQNISTDQLNIKPDTLFHTGKFDKLLSLEKKLISENYLNAELHWISTHQNGKPDIKSLIIFLLGLLENNYFLPNKDPKIKVFFESRYHIEIGQNFERKRREPLADRYKAVFYEYSF